jgi:hypothetical protein
MYREEMVFGKQFRLFPDEIPDKELAAAESRQKR